MQRASHAQALAQAAMSAVDIGRGFQMLCVGASTLLCSIFWTLTSCFVSPSLVTVFSS